MSDSLDLHTQSTDMEGRLMNDQQNNNIDHDDTQQITNQLPYRLIKRAEKYASENGNTVTGVLIEALDTFLRGQKVD
jgi:hypothetical protein